MKRVNNLFPKLISDENIREAICTVNASHRTHKGRVNNLVLWVESTIDERIIELRNIIREESRNRSNRYKNNKSE